MAQMTLGKAIANRAAIGTGGGIRAVAPALVRESAGFGIPILDSDYREGDLTAADTWATLSDREGAGDGAIKVPAKSGYAYITSVTIMLAVTASGLGAAGQLATNFACQLSGNALRKGGFYRFIGPSLSQLQYGTGDICGSVMLLPVTYATAIPVTNGEITVQGNMLGEDAGTVTMGVILTFGASPSPGGYVDGDVRDVALTALNTLAAATALGGDTPGTPIVPSNASKLAGIAIAAALDPGTSVVTVGLIGVVQITGTGLAEGGSYRFGYVGPTVNGATGGSQSAAMLPTIVDTEIPVEATGQLELKATMLGADPGTAEVAIGLLYR